MGSSPIRVAILKITFICHADLAHLVERHLAKVEVAGSSPVIRSNKIKALEIQGFYFIRGQGREVGAVVNDS